ncbi:hypothetical protein [Streptomyces niveus]|uniref:hypothetical protein n=1 Tax=Streptomyces niveus TaxID=193462 RepID=UPI00342A8C88
MADERAEIGLRPAAPADDWRRRPDIAPATVSRACFAEELVAERTVSGAPSTSSRGPETADHLADLRDRPAGYRPPTGCA